MITNKDREDAVSMTRIWIRDSEGNQLEELAGIISRIRAESADQARKEYQYKIGRLISFVNGILLGSDDYTFSKVAAMKELEAIMKEIQG